MVLHEFDLQFLRDNADTETLRETLVGQVNTQDIIDSVKSARLVLDNQNFFFSMSILLYVNFILK